MKDSTGFTQPLSKAQTQNPKDILGSKKVSISRIPAIALLHCAMAQMDGAKKYGPYNWRAKDVIASIYIDALYRHVMAWFEGQETAEDTGIHHLGHAMACLAILMDAESRGKLVDDRPFMGEPTLFSEALKILNSKV